ncbi:aldehyde dehydrogenase family protein [Flavihumibacter sp. R14]|nr:aldehyde dehydrogenase family protein [Flavihumibacter soli]
MKEIFDLQKAHSPHLRTTGSSERKDKLRKLKSIIESSETDIFEALYQDLGKSEFEAALSELYIVYSEIDFAIKNLDRWMKPRKVRVTLSSLLSKNRIYYEPKGVCLIIAPWNYPFQLLISPLISAIAAGNCAMLKPSELSCSTSHVLTRMINANFESSEIACFEGDATCAEELLSLPFDHIFFTGSTDVGKKVMAAAAKNLSPVTLELGGKSPVIIDENVSLEKVVDKIMWGKFINAGQTCIAPDYVLIRAEQQDKFLELSRSVLKKMYYAEGVLDENSYGKIISQRHFERLNGLLRQAVDEGAIIDIGGASNEEKQIIEPTVVSNVDPQSGLMQEEIFGPLLPIINYKSLEEAIRFINDRPKPLALYIFSDTDSSAETIIKQTSAGGTTVNDIAIHFANSSLPFGGVGTSGMGSSHGFYGFRAFSHERAVTFQSKVDFNRLAYPPYGNKKGLLKWLKKVI